MYGPPASGAISVSANEPSSVPGFGVLVGGKITRLAQLRHLFSWNYSSQCGYRIGLMGPEEGSTLVPSRAKGLPRYWELVQLAGGEDITRMTKEHSEQDVSLLFGKLLMHIL